MAAQFGFVVHAAQAQALELAAQRARDRLAERGLADARRADEAEDRRFGLRVELEHAEVFEDALLDLLQIEVVFVEHLPGAREVELVLGGLVPGQLEDEVEIGRG